MAFLATELSDKINGYLSEMPYMREPKGLYAPIEYVLSLGGKRIRPVLMLLAYNMYKEDVDCILPQAAGIDPVATGELYNLIKLVNLCNDITVIMVTHDIDAALRYATHVLHLGHQQLFFGTAAEYKQSDAARRFLGGRKL